VQNVTDATIGGKMKKIYVLAMVGITCLSCLAGCGRSQGALNDVIVNDEIVTDEVVNNDEEKDEVVVTESGEEAYIGAAKKDSVQDYQLFPRKKTSYVGDPMPYYEDGVFHVFYLDDLRNGEVGYHPWSLFETSNFYEYEDKGEVIPYADSVQKQDNALGTGSVIKDKNGLYHAFYTGHNDTYKPKEAIMHATSSDMINWTKIPEDILYAGDTYSNDDFRDPYVFYVEEEKQYWMLVTTTYEYKAVIAKYTSKDLKTWTDGGVLFRNDMGSNSNLECPSLLCYKGKWYLTFSDQTSNKQFHYRVSDTVYGPYEKPEQDVIDGTGFYAGRLETDGENLYAFGWNGTKNEYLDSEAYGWAGNLVVHQLKQKENGDLVPVLNTHIKEKMINELTLYPIAMTETIQMDGNNYSLNGKDYEVVEFNDLKGSYLLKCKIKNFQDAERFGFAFNTDGYSVGALNIVFNVEEDRIEFYNTNEIYVKKPQSKMNLNFADINELDVSILISDGVVSMYVNEQCALTARMSGSQRKSWGIFGINSAIQFEDVRIYK